MTDYTRAAIWDDVKTIARYLEKFGAEPSGLDSPPRPANAFSAPAAKAMDTSRSAMLLPLNHPRCGD